MLTETTIEIVRSGGLANVLRSASLSAADLAEEDRDRLEALLEAVPSLQLEQAAPAGPGADRYQYDIRIDRAGETESGTVTEAAVTPELAELIDFVFQHGRR